MQCLARLLAALLALAILPVQAAAEDAGGVLILGDSNAEGPFGGALYNALRTTSDPVTHRPLNVSIFAKCGAGANDWTSRDYARIDCGAWACNGRPIALCMHFNRGAIPPLADLYADLGATRRVTILALGLNMIIGRRSEKLRDAERLIAAIHANSSACIWIGPPEPGDLFVDPDRYEDFIADLRATVRNAGCRYIRSDDKTDRRNVARRDDHYSRDDAIAWARAVLVELERPSDEGDRPLLALLAK
ncbi:MAG: hypothetical protein ISS15_13660 [Alphaproteobacteria bacterium]|nr:hypothetical protein [Alphaproteobacteria bacterium]MBL6936249.1 hypothetical protein [Alphaproteobacteria bacterium]MBL7098700.1 hypothetical protein [Alphaproteobacteria bacterium]